MGGGGGLEGVVNRILRCAIASWALLGTNAPTLSCGGRRVLALNLQGQCNQYECTLHSVPKTVGLM